MGGGSVDVPNVDDRNFRNEKRTLGQGYNFQTGQLDKYGAGQPLLAAGNKAALDNAAGLGGLTAPISALSAQLPSFFGGLQNQVGGLQQDLSGYSNQLGSLLPQISRYQQQGQGLFGQLGGLSSRLGGILGAPGGPSGIVSSGGALTGGLLRAANQQSLSDQERAGVAHTTSGLAQGILNRDEARSNRLAGAQQLIQQVTQGQAGIAGAQGGLTGLLANLVGQKAGIVGQQAGITGQQAGLGALKAGLFGQQGALTTQLPAAIQALQTGSLNQLYGGQGANVSAFTGTTNPILGYISNLFSGNQQKDVNLAAGSLQAQAANQGKASEGIGSILSIVGPILGAVVGSDERLKTKIRDTKFKTKEGIAVKSFEYKTKPGVSYLGVLAQDVEKRGVGGVIEDPISGIKFVDANRFPVIRKA